MSPVKRYVRDGATVSFDAEVCVHSGNCVRGLPEVFDTSRRPWVQPENATIDALEAAIARCPSGALGFERTSPPA
jgi:uncharacterized Fe-S cluster protein YjdI